MRLDKFLCDLNVGTRSQVKDFVRQGLVKVNGATVKKADIQIQEDKDEVCFKGQECRYQRFIYLMLNKPAGVVSATKDNLDKTVLELLNGVSVKGLFPAGRLDKDTEGLLLITNDGELAHRLLSPGRHVDKMYLVHLRSPLLEEDIFQLENGISIGDERSTLPAKVNVLDSLRIQLVIHEGRFHQVKRMLHAVGNEVVFLKRLTFGSLVLDEKLAPGEFRELTQSEIDGLMKNF